MSRHVLLNSLDHEVVVGWDPPLERFFAHVYDARLVKLIDDAIASGNPFDPEPETLLVDVEDTTLAGIVRAVSPYVTVSDAMIIELRNDKQTSLPPSPLQQMVRSMLGGEDG
jgi:hypothetical protein